MLRLTIPFAVLLAACVVKTAPVESPPPTPTEPEATEPEAFLIGCLATGDNVAGGKTGESQRVTCAAGCSQKGPVWGTGLYTRDSHVCQAAIHAGVIGDDGGAFTVRQVDGASVFSGSEANGVTTNDFGANPRAFRVEP